MKKERKMKKIFIVDGMLKINPVKIPEEDWKKGLKNDVFTAGIDGQPIIAHPRRWSKFSTYAGFATKRAAENFRVRMS
jgi:hypothetical protein